VLSFFHFKAVKDLKTVQENRQHEARKDPLDIGNILLKNGIVTESQLDEAISEQIARRESGRDVFIGVVLVARGVCTEAQIESGLQEQRKAHLPDDSKAHAAMDRLDEILNKSKRSGRRNSAMVTKMTLIVKEG